MSKAKNGINLTFKEVKTEDVPKEVVKKEEAKEE